MSGSYLNEPHIIRKVICVVVLVDVEFNSLNFLLESRLLLKIDFSGPDVNVGCICTRV
jgi:hypothetical protein